MNMTTLDLSLSTNGSNSDRQRFASQLLGSLSQRGFVKLVGHGISEEAIAKLFEWVRSTCHPSFS